jgi:hypothetical protein
MPEVKDQLPETKPADPATLPTYPDPEGPKVGPDEVPVPPEAPVEPVEQDREEIAKAAARGRKDASEIGKAQEKLERSARASKKFGFAVEISVKAVGMVPSPSRIIDIDKESAGKRAAILEELIDELQDQLL